MKFAYAIPLLIAALSFRGNAEVAAREAQNGAKIAAAALYSGRDLGHAAANERVDLSIVLPYRHAAELPQLLKLQQEPDSKYFRRFLRAAEFREYFSPTVAAYTAAARKLRASGFTVTTFANRTVLHATGTANSAEHLFVTRINAVRLTNGRLAYANVAPAAMPAELAQSRVVGLSDVMVAQTTSSNRRPLDLRPAVGVLKQFGPDGGYGPAVIAAVEDFPVEHGYRGRNSNVADLVDSPVSDNDTNYFLNYFGIKRGGPRTTTINVDGGCATHCFDGFQATVDAESILGAAPDASLFTYEIPSFTNGSITDGVNAIVSDDAVNIVNFGFASCEVQTNDLKLAIEQLVAQGTAEGITFEAPAFGGANVCDLGADIPVTPTDLDTVTAVGGSNALLDAQGRLVGQSAFPNSNGGVSLLVPLPAWQAHTNGVKSAGRNVPDIVMPGEIDGVGPSVYSEGEWQGGYAFVNNAPFAGYLATVQQYWGYATPLGNIAPALYTVFRAHGFAGGSAAYFTDITYGNIGIIGNVPVSAKPGYDLATGIGSIEHGFALAKSLGYRKP